MRGAVWHTGIAARHAEQKVRLQGRILEVGACGKQGDAAQNRSACAPAVPGPHAAPGKARACQHERCPWHTACQAQQLRPMWAKPPGPAPHRLFDAQRPVRSKMGSKSGVRQRLDLHAKESEQRLGRWPAESRQPKHREMQPD